LQGQRAEFEKRGAALVALSVDSVELSKDLAEREQLSLTLVSDPKRHLIQAFGLDDPVNEISWPAVYVLGRDGKVVWRAFLQTYKERPPVSDILAAVDRATGEK
jgi:peroxiredoxin